MPLAAIHNLIYRAKTGDPSPLISPYDAQRGLVYVSRDFFRSSPGGNAPDSVTDDVLGFCSLVLSYAKNARELTPGTSIKALTNIMPRTDFLTIFRSLLRMELRGRLYDTIKVLACYKNKKGETTAE